MASRLRKAIGAVKDQTSISLTKVSNNNTSNLRIAILKATSHDDVPMDDCHVHEILQFVSSSKLYASYCARAIGKRVGRTRNWIVAIKSLLLILRIFQDGDPYFPREILHAMRRGATILNLSSFRDDSNSTPWEFTVFVRVFASYLDDRLDCFLTGKLQRRYTTYNDNRAEFSSPSSPHLHRSNHRSYEPVRNIKPPMMLDKISYWQRLLDRAIETKPTGEAKSNRLVQICLYAIIQETFDLYKDISDALTLLLDSFFHLQHQICVSVYHTSVKASKQYEDLRDFYGLCKEMGVGRTSEYPCVQCISKELMATLQEFLKDQSSFPTIAKSPNNQPLLLLSEGSSPSLSRRSSRRGSISEYSDTTRYYECSSEFGVSRVTSLEELINATENRIVPSNSIALEDYYDQFEKQSQRDSTFMITASGSTRSLPQLNSMVDLLSLDGWPSEDDKEILHENKIDSNDIPEATIAATMQSSNIIETNNFNVSHPSYFNAFFNATTSSSSMQASNANNNFDVFPEETQSHPFLLGDSSEAATSATQPSNTTWNIQHTPSHPFLLMDSSEATTYSTQQSNTPWTRDMFDTSYQVPTHSFQHFPFNSYQEIHTPTTQYTTDSPNLNTFYQTNTQPMQDFTDMKNRYSHGHGLDPNCTEFSNFSNQDHTEQNNEHDEVPITGWELATVESFESGQSTSNMHFNFNPSTFDSIYNQPSYNQVCNHSSSTPNYYNPFLQDPTEQIIFEQFPPTFQTTQAPTFSTQHHTHEVTQSPTFSAEHHTFQSILTPTFSTQQQPIMAGSDPFAAGYPTPFSERMTYESMSQHNMLQQPSTTCNYPLVVGYPMPFSERMSYESMRQHNLLQQQLWLQKQNKIIEKHVA